VTSQTIALPDLPDGCETPEYRPVWLPIDPREYVLIGDQWRRADSVIRQGGAFWIVCRTIAAAEVTP
jgi:hypothetical protein